MSFDYLVDKIHGAKVETEPFRHVQINDFFSKEQFAQIVSAPEIAVHGLTSDSNLFETLFENGYKIIEFPGCITSKDAYIAWHKDRKPDQRHNNSACEGFGVTLRLMSPRSRIISELTSFLAGEAFQHALATKFDIDRAAVFYDFGIQKYLDGYEISPHPDIRRKALTYMVNINPGRDSEEQDHHTHYLRLREAYRYVQAYWEGRPNEERCWVPWDWCDSVKVQRENNSIVIFSPDNNTMHGVKARYDHLESQRTQLYGNLWYREENTLGGPEWEDFLIGRTGRESRMTVTSRLKAAVPAGVRRFLKKRLRTFDRYRNVVSDRFLKD